MPAQDQDSGSNRYSIIPRTAVFLRHGDAYLLLKGAADKKLWPGLYNGLGGHVERGEDPLTSAGREVLEETGITASLWLCGTVIVDAGTVGIGLYVFSGEALEGPLRGSSEGQAEWIHVLQIPGVPAVEDVPLLIQRIHQMRRGDPPFIARSYYDDSGKLRLQFSN
jgi:8-oxo-dGTP diphosphatase